MHGAESLADLNSLDLSAILYKYFPRESYRNRGSGAMVMRALLSFGDRHTGEHVFPSYESVSAKAACCVKTVQRWVRKFQAAGILDSVFSYVANLWLPQEFRFTRKFLAALIRANIEACASSAKKWMRRRLESSLRYLAAVPVEAAKSVQWRKMHPRAVAGDGAPKSSETGRRTGCPPTPPLSGVGMIGGVGAAGIGGKIQATAAPTSPERTASAAHSGTSGTFKGSNPILSILKSLAGPRVRF